jgi:hypothetical protein
MTDPQKPTLEDLYPDLARPALPPGWPTIYEPGQNLSTIKYDHTSGVRDRRTPETLIPMEQVLCGQLGLPADNFRLARAYILDLGAVAIWEQLDDAGDVSRYVVASYAAGTDRLHLVYARELPLAEGRAAEARFKLEQDAEASQPS